MNNTNTMRFSGNAQNNVAGTIFMPAAPLVYNGTGNLNPSQVQIIGYTGHWDSNLPVHIGLMQSS